MIARAGYAIDQDKIANDRKRKKSDAPPVLGSNFSEETKKRKADMIVEFRATREAEAAAFSERVSKRAKTTLAFDVMMGPGRISGVVGAPVSVQGMNCQLVVDGQCVGVDGLVDGKVFKVCERTYPCEKTESIG